MIDLYLFLSWDLNKTRIMDPIDGATKPEANTKKYIIKAEFKLLSWS